MYQKVLRFSKKTSSIRRLSSITKRSLRRSNFSDKIVICSSDSSNSSTKATVSWQSIKLSPISKSALSLTTTEAKKKKEEKKRKAKKKKKGTRRAERTWCRILRKRESSNPAFVAFCDRFPSRASSSSSSSSSSSVRRVLLVLPLNPATGQPLPRRARTPVRHKQRLDHNRRGKQRGYEGISYRSSSLRLVWHYERSRRHDYEHLPPRYRCFSSSFFSCLAEHRCA